MADRDPGTPLDPDAGEHAEAVKAGIRICIVGNSRLFRMSIAQVLASEGIEIVSSFSSYQELSAASKRTARHGCKTEKNIRVPKDSRHVGRFAVSDGGGWQAARLRRSLRLTLSVFCIAF